MWSYHSTVMFDMAHNYTNAAIVALVARITAGVLAGSDCEAEF